jgi:hypothetical protein
LSLQKKLEEILSKEYAMKININTTESTVVPKKASGNVSQHIKFLLVILKGGI